MQRQFNVKTRPRRRQRRRRSQVRGSALIEFAVVANIAFVMILACMEFARANTIRNLVQDAAYYAARSVIVPGATEEEAIEEAERVLNSVVSSGYTVDVSELDFDSEEVTVTVAVDFNQVGLFTPIFMPDDANINATVRMQTERYTGFYEQ